MTYTSHKTAGEQTGRQLKKMLPKPDHDYLIKGKPKPKSAHNTKKSGRNTGKSMYKGRMAPFA